MKTCSECGTLNYYEDGKPFICECGKDLKTKSLKLAPEHLRGGCKITKKKLLHDEYPWEFSHGD